MLNLKYRCESNIELNMQNHILNILKIKILIER